MNPWLLSHISLMELPESLIAPVHHSVLALMGNGGWLVGLFPLKMVLVTEFLHIHLVHILPPSPSGYGDLLMLIRFPTQLAIRQRRMIGDIGQGLAKTIYFELNYMMDALLPHYSIPGETF